MIYYKDVVVRCSCAEQNVWTRALAVDSMLRGWRGDPGEDGVFDADGEVDEGVALEQALEAVAGLGDGCLYVSVCCVCACV